MPHHRQRIALNRVQNHGEALFEFRRFIMFRTRTKVEFVEVPEPKHDSFIEDMLKWVRWGKSIKPKVEEVPSDDPFINDMRAWTRWGRQR